MGKPVKKLVNLEVLETSGVDRAAHLHDGFLVMKSVDDSALPNKENNLSSVQEQIDLAVTKAVEGYEEKVAGLEAALEAAKNQATDLAAKLEEISSMQTGEETAEDATMEKHSPETDEAMKDMPEDVAKSLNEMPLAQRELIAKAFKAQSDEIRKERDVRLDAEAVAKSKEQFKNIGIDHDVVAPALRRLTDASPELAAVVESVLLAADAQVSESGLLKEFGSTTAKSGSVLEEAKTLAKSLVENGTVKTIEQGIEKVLDSNPELAKRYAQEGAN